jgi:hypothetical protein
LSLGALAAPLTFSNTPLILPTGSSEPAIAFDNDGNMALTGLSWLTFGTNFWTGSFGATPTFQGQIDMNLQQPGRRVFGGGDADVDIGTNGTAGGSDYKAAIRQLLVTQKFQQLDYIADIVLAGKSQFAGGRWKLNVLYWAIEEPQGHAAEVFCPARTTNLRSTFARTMQYPGVIRCQVLARWQVPCGHDVVRVRQKSNQRMEV